MCVKVGDFSLRFCVCDLMYIGLKYNVLGGTL